MPTQLEEEKLQLRRVQSMLRMLEGNTHADDLKKLERGWLRPIEERIEDLGIAARSEGHGG